MTALLREEILQYALDYYGTTPEYLWAKYPGYAVLRHRGNKKWYAIIMDVPREKLGLPGSGTVDIMDLKCDPLMSGSLLGEKGILPGYHMNKEKWITVLLDGSVERDTVLALLDMSHELTSSRKPAKKSKPLINQDWIIPANPKYFDLEKAFAESDTIFWKQSSNMMVGDTVYLYVAAPVSAIMYQCKTVEVDIPTQYDDGKVRMNRMMKIQLLHRFSEDQLDFKKLNAHGIFAVRGPRHIPNSLLHEIKNLIRH